MARKSRTYKQVKEEKSSLEFKRFEKEVTERYATSDLECSQADVARDNNITVKCLRQMMDDAIIYAYVSMGIAIKVKDKAIMKSKAKAEQAGGRSISHHESLIRQREEFLLTSITNSEVRGIAEYFANNPSKTISQITKKHNLDSERVTKLILKKSIVENIVSDEIVELIIKRSLGTNPSEKAKQVFGMFCTERNKYKESH